METCQTCYTELASRSRAAYINPCCDTPICARCIEQNPRLRAHVPCLKCGDAKAGSVSGSRAKGAVRRVDGGGEAQAAQRQYDVNGQFTIGEDEDEEEEGERSRDEDGSDQAGLDERSEQDATSAPARKDGPREGDEPETEVVEVTHPVARGDTLMGIARKYATDPHDLLKLNSLPATALSTNPRILHTRRTIIISRKHILARPGVPASAPGGVEVPLATVSEEQAAEEAERQKRQAERSVKRFQLMTKTEDPAIGRVYLALAQEGLIGSAGRVSSSAGDGKEGKGVGDGDGAYEAAVALYEADQKSNGVRGANEKVSRHGKETRATDRGLGTGGKEQDALDAFYSDEEWEAAAGGPSRTGIGAGSGGGRGLNKVKGVGGRWTISPSTGTRAVEGYQKA